MKKIGLFVLCILLTFGCCSAFASAQDPASGTLKVVNYNVDGLPVPSFLSNTGRNPIACTEEIARQLKAMKPDIVGVQEDFEFHALLRGGLDMEAFTPSDGGTGTGSGCNLFSSRTLYNVGREKWKDAYGVFDAGSDELTPKGVVYATVDLGEGAYVDIYDCHIDAFDDEGSKAAKRSQYEQLNALIKVHSGEKHAVIVMGDMNMYFSSQPGKYLRQLLVDEGGFKEAWVEANLNGDYDTEKYDVIYETGRWGIWDSAEKIFFRSSDAVSLSVSSCDYINLKFEDGRNLSDHAAQVAVLNYTVHADHAEKEAVKENTVDIVQLVKDFVDQLLKTVKKLLMALPDLLTGKVKIEFIK